MNIPDLVMEQEFHLPVDDFTNLLLLLQNDV